MKETKGEFPHAFHGSSAFLFNAEKNYDSSNQVRGW